VVNFHHIANIKKGHQHQQTIFNLKIHILVSKNDIILQWDLGLVIKIYKYFNQ
jgi:hypothetical protein